MTRHGTTPSQTIGPFFDLPGGMLWPGGPEIVAEGTPGAFVVRGRVFDGAENPVSDGVIETWQADEQGQFPDDPRGGDSAVHGLGRCGTGTDGSFWFRTIKPGVVPTAEGQPQAPHLNVSVFARGLLHRVVTRLYFPDDGAAHADDPILSAVDGDRRSTLIAARGGDDVRFDIHLQGAKETVFFAV
ncbi:protocatechuate 3,4-dioxygenase subunit alpha [Allosaccharopolyspora coralli]|uniref:Protocatechuate 3,4-dioxygenase subunit alpha n=1 Tax=Allosaccharopolyspora coralli TaxID=2665642 RepID=A0A5Q3QAJ0_9PSEU|nr:protocatechuate 3,4-dioxygenase subunit alpha [Allosaccharopolyspora coralli]QGK71403.1 protocatechuate 3,4-dioxygenase subunit alpha [Allosaccharopolyspora coralli]